MMRRLSLALLALMITGLFWPSTSGAQSERVPWPSGDSVTAIRQEAGYSSSDAEVLRLYRAFFTREPDPVGARYWIELRRDGLSLEEISSNFVVSAEFINTYGELSDAAFVARVYENVIGRTADAEGLVYWTGELTSGRLSRGGVVYWITANEELIRSYPYGALGRDLNAVDLSGAAMPVGVCEHVTPAQRTLLNNDSVWTGSRGEYFALHDVDNPAGPFYPFDFDEDGRRDIAFIVACFDADGVATSSGIGIWLSGQDPIDVGFDVPGVVASGHRHLTYRERSPETELDFLAVDIVLTGPMFERPQNDELRVSSNADGYIHALAIGA